MGKNKRRKNENVRLSGNKLISMCGVFIALALVLSYLESLIPLSFAVPGIKLGLANIVTIIALVKLGFTPAVIISLGRILLSGILFGNPMVIIYSLAGAMLGIFIMCVVKALRIFTVTGMSVCGAVFHNLGQLIVACIVLENANIFYYMAVLLITGTVAGVVIGILAGEIMKNIRF